jgi:hypothetical protein
VTIYVLAFNQREAAKWASDENLRLRDIRYVHSVSVLPYTNRRGQDRIVELPGYSRRRDRHAINDRLKSLTRRDLFQIERPFDKGGILPPGPVEATNDTGEPIRILSRNDLVLKALEQGAEFVDTTDSNESVSDEHSDQLVEELDALAVDLEQLQETAQEAADIQPEDPAEGQLADQLDVIEKLNTQVAAKPKRVRRNNQQIEYDEARAALDANPTDLGLTARLSQAREKLAERDPKDPRLAEDPLDF